MITKDVTETTNIERTPVDLSFLQGIEYYSEFSDKYPELNLYNNVLVIKWERTGLLNHLPESKRYEVAVLCELKGRCILDRRF
jgi:hypothetical protein